LKQILIIYPHFPPSNLAGVHRPRLFARHLCSFGWKPVILTVHEKFFEEALDWNLVKLLPVDLRIEKVNAFKIGKFRAIGDIGLRAFFQLYKRAKQLIKAEQFDFLYIPIPSFYCALLGRFLHASTNIKYGIDYIDPWVHQFPGSEHLFTRHWFSKKLATLLEPIAVKKASLITGVAEGYYMPVLERNVHLKQSAVCGAMPYGGEREDHILVDGMNLVPYLFEKKQHKIQLIYAGAMLPRAYKPLEAIFKSIISNPHIFSNLEIHFIGTGKTSDDPSGYNIMNLAKKFDLWESIVFEHPKRIPYLDVLAHLKIADGIFILGSTEPHYTPSKTYQGVLSGKPLLAVLHKNSTAVNVIKISGAGLVLSFDGETDLEKIESDFAPLFNEYMTFIKNFHSSQVNTDVFEQYSAESVTWQLATLLDKALLNNA